MVGIFLNLYNYYLYQEYKLLIYLFIHFFIYYQLYTNIQNYILKIESILKGENFTLKRQAATF